MRILGIDCGAHRTGYGVVDTDGRVHRWVTSGAIVTRPRDPFGVRLEQIHAGLRSVLRKHAPEIVAVEDIFHGVNAKSALKLAHVRGVALLLAAQEGLLLGEYSPLEVKMAVVGYGRADKAQVQLMVSSLLCIANEGKSFDASDALAVAICHATRTLGRVRERAASGG